MKIVAISDLHGHAGFQIPQCDLLLIAGDICADRVGPFWTRHYPEMCITYMENRIFPWLGPLLYDKQVGHVMMTWGNHDWTQGLRFDKLPKGMEILVDQESTYQGLRCWGSPWSNEFMQWAWMRSPEALRPYYEAIPEGVDIIMSHAPPYGKQDQAYVRGEHLGSKQLADAIVRVKPKLVVCGHIHGGYGMDAMDGTGVYNVSVVNERYELVNPVTVIDL